MSTEVKLRRGTTAEHATFTGVQGEVTVDTTKKTAVVHDGTTAGGHPILKEAAIGVSVQGYDATTLKSAAIGVTVQAYDADLTSWAAIAPAAKQDALVSGSNIKTINGATLLGSTDILLLPATNPVITGSVTEDVYALSGTTPALDPANGTIQTWTLSGNSTPTDSLADGQSMTLMIDDGTAYTITWPTVVWVGGSAPTLATTGKTVIELWQVSSTLYGALVGSVA